MIKELYDEYMKVRKKHTNIPANQAFLWARSELVRRCRNQLIDRRNDPRHPDVVREALCSQSAYFSYKGYDCKLAIEPDDLMLDDDVLGYTISRNTHPYREPGWGHDGMDRGLYACVDAATLVTFHETRAAIITYAPQGMSRQMAYEWATQSMRDRLDYYIKCGTGDICSFVVAVECDELGIMECLGGVDIDITDSDSEKYVAEIVEEMFDQFKREFDKQKKVA